MAINVIVAQVQPCYCTSYPEFQERAEKLVRNIVSLHKNVELLVLPELLGLWMSGIGVHDMIPRDLALSSPAGLQLFGAQSELTASVSASTWDRIIAYVLRSVGASWLFARLRNDRQVRVYRETFSHLAASLGIAIQAGTIVERVDGSLRNVAYTFGPSGDVIGRQEKLHPLASETALGITPGRGIDTWEVSGVPCGVAVCADVNPQYKVVDWLSERGAEFVCCPSGGWAPCFGWRWDFDRDMVHVDTAVRAGVMIGRSYHAGDMLPGVCFRGRSSIVWPDGSFKFARYSDGGVRV
jgi:predicted amidohydrolase